MNSSQASRISRCSSFSVEPTLCCYTYFWQTDDDDDVVGFCDVANEDLRKQTSYLLLNVLL